MFNTKIVKKYESTLSRPTFQSSSGKACQKFKDDLSFSVRKLELFTSFEFQREQLEASSIIDCKRGDAFESARNMLYSSFYFLLLNILFVWFTAARLSLFSP